MKKLFFLLLIFASAVLGQKFTNPKPADGWIFRDVQHANPVISYWDSLTNTIYMVNDKYPLPTKNIDTVRVHITKSALDTAKIQIMGASLTNVIDTNNSYTHFFNGTSDSIGRAADASNYSGVSVISFSTHYGSLKLQWSNDGTFWTTGDSTFSPVPAVVTNPSGTYQVNMYVNKLSDNVKAKYVRVWYHHSPFADTVRIQTILHKNNNSVTVTNTPSVTISGTVPVSGAVSITGTPSVIITNTPTVNVVSSDTVTKKVFITNTPTVNVNQMSADTVTRKVTVSNTPSVTISGTPTVNATLVGTNTITEASSNFKSLDTVTSASNYETLTFGFTPTSITIVNDDSYANIMYISNSTSFLPASTIRRYGGEYANIPLTWTTIYYRFAASMGGASLSGKAYRIEAR